MLIFGQFYSAKRFEILPRIDVGFVAEGAGDDDVSFLWDFRHDGPEVDSFFDVQVGANVDDDEKGGAIAFVFPVKRN